MNSSSADARFVSWLSERIDWLTKEAHSGGNWEYLNSKREECAYILERFKLLSSADAGAKP